jgi:hypothetical protein
VVIDGQPFGVFMHIDGVSYAVALAEITAMPLGMHLPALGTFVSGEVIWHATHNDQVKVRLDEWLATGERSCLGRLWAVRGRSWATSDDHHRQVWQPTPTGHPSGSATLEPPCPSPENRHDEAGLADYGGPVLEHDGGLVAWLESKRLLTSPKHHIDTLRCLLAEDDDALLMHDYDLISDPQTVAIVRAQQRAAGQRRRRLRRLATRRRSAK